MTLMATSIALFSTADGFNRELDPIAHAVSRFVHGEQGWLVPLAVVVAALGTGAGYAVLRRSLARVPDVGVRRALAFLKVAWLALLVAAIVPAQPVGYRVLEWVEVVHGGAGWIALLGFPFAAFALHRELRSRVLLAVGVVATVLTGCIVVEWIGLTQTYYAFRWGSHHTTFGLVERAAMYSAFCWLGLAAWLSESRPVRGTGAAEHADPPAPVPTPDAGPGLA